MLNVPASTRIFLASEPVDIRKGFDALAGWVLANGLDVYSGHLFVFLSRRMTHVKVLTWSRGGFVLFYKRLERGRFRFPERVPGARTVHLDSTELAMLLDGMDIKTVQRSKVWTPGPGRIDSPT
jgi:transposase